MNWSDHQRAIFSAIADTEDSLLVEAVAGSGKTSTIVEAINYVPEGKSVCFVAFNKSIAEELGRRVTRRGAVCQTLHSVGFAAWKRGLGWDSNLCKVNGSKVYEIMKEVMSWKEREKYGSMVSRMVSIGKQVGIVPLDRATKVLFGFGEDGRPTTCDLVASYKGLVSDTSENWEALADHYNVDFEELGQKGMDLTREVLIQSIERSKEEVDFDDMLYLPVVGGVEFSRWDVVFVDEAQDLSGIQIEMVSRMAGKTGRVIAVGDRNQAIYGFRGAHSASMDELERRFRCRTLPLSVSYRCPTAVVQKAKEWVPQIEWAEGAASGYVGEEGTDWREGTAAELVNGVPMSYACWNPSCKGDCQECEEHKRHVAVMEREEGISKWKEIGDLDKGDAILCRVTRPLVEVAFALVRLRKPVRMAGRDIGKGLVAVVDKVCKASRGRISREDALGAFEEGLGEWELGMREKLAQKKKWQELARLEDQIQTIKVFILGMEERNARTHRTCDGDGAVDLAQESGLTVGDLVSEIEGLFSDNSDPKRTITLSTVHRAKGLEWERVFVLEAGQFMPSRWARQEWELAQERNLMYVAATRSRRELRYVTLEDLGLGGTL